MRRIQRAHPLDGRAMLCYTVSQWEEQTTTRYGFHTRFEVEPEFLTTLKAAVDTIFPGARKAFVHQYIIESLQTNYRGDLSTYQKGLKQLQIQANMMFSRPFDELSQEDLTLVLEKLVETDFFETIRQHTMEGMFADPKYGGNRNMIGWKLINYPGAQFHPITDLSRGWITPNHVSLRGEVRTNHGNKKI